MPLLNINIDGHEIKVESGETILNAAIRNKIYIPTLCNDERVKMYGSCGICVVESENSPRLLRACSTLVADGMKIKTNSERAINTRKTALELLLSDHKGDCRAPCVLACPAQTDCQGYVGLIANGEYREAAELMKENLPLPSSIGRICPHPCEKACRRVLVEEPINIAHLKYFASDRFIGENELVPEIAAKTGKTVAIIGGGPGGLTAAYFLRQLGHSVTVYDAMPEMGGMLRYGIPEYRLPKNILDKEISIISKMGVKFINNTKIGPALTLDNLQSNYDAVVIAIGAWSSVKLGCTGENSNGVIGGIDFLRNVILNKTPFIGEKVAIVGGGNTAMDACRTAVRLGAKEVYNIYRRTRAEMPAEEIEIIEAEEEGVIFKYLTNPVEITEDNGRISKIRLQKMKLGEPDSSGRRSPVPVEGPPGSPETEEILAVDTFIIAIGQSPETSGFEKIMLTRRNTIAADEFTFRTNINGVFAVGDATNKGADIAISAIGEAKKSVSVIDGYLRGENISYVEPFVVKSEPTEKDFADREKKPRAKMRHLSPGERKNNFREINFGFSEDEALNEAKRCLECGCIDFFECKLIDITNDYSVEPKKYEGEITPHVANNDDPFIHRNPDKCILCGLCVRICEELMGVTALGIVDRGFDTVVKPAFDASLKDSGCISCGQCVTVCPTGALTEKIAAYKQVPLKENAVHTVCSFCSVGCKTLLTYKGDMLLRSLPDNSTDTQQILCEKGRFGFTELEKTGRLRHPLVSGAETGLDDAGNYINKKMQEIISRYGREAAGICVSDRLTNEEIILAKKYAGLLGIGIYSFNRKKSGLAAVTGKDASTCSFDDLLGADVILLAVNDIMKSHPVAGIYIRRAVQNGAKLITVDNGNISGVIFNANEKGVIIFEQNALAEAEAAKLAGIAMSNGNENQQAGIIQLKPNANSQGLADLDIGYYGDFIEKINNQTIKGLIVLAEDFSGVDLSGLEFLCVGDTHMTETARKAEVVLPFASFAESSGTYTNTVGQVQKLNPVRLPPGRFSNTEIIQNLIGK